MEPYSPKKIRPLNIIAWMLRGLANLSRLWPLSVIALFMVSPEGPHMRWQYTYHTYGAVVIYTSCEYLGSRGFVQHMERGGNCPFITIIDRSVIR